jgi:hypothetical protein
MVGLPPSSTVPEKGDSKNGNYPEDANGDLRIVGINRIGTS